MPKKKNEMSLGAIVDEVADQYFAAGCDVFTANLMALNYVASVLQESLGSLVDILRGPDVSPESEVQP